ncbi:MAG: site-specific integrase [bacterium]
MSYEGGRLIRRRVSKYFENRDLAKAFWHEKSKDSEAFKAGLTKTIPITLNRFIAEMTEGHFAHRSPKYLAGEWGRLDLMATYWEGKEMHKIEAPEIQAFLYRLSDQGLASKTVKNYHGLLSLIFNQAKLRHHVESNPMEYVPAPKVVPRREVTALSEIDIARLVKAGESPAWEKAVKTALILIHTGMRLGEMLKVRVERDVDFERNCLRVRSVEGAETKNKKPRVIPFSDVCRGFFAEIRVGPIWSETGRVFDAQLRKLGDVLKIHLHAHRFRHTFASLNLAAGVPEPMVSAWLGHGSSAITKRYTHMSGYDLQFARLEVGKNLRPICAQFDEKSRKVMTGDDR